MKRVYSEEEAEEIAELEREMERIRALSASNMAVSRTGDAQEVTLNLEKVSPGDVHAMAMAAIPALLEKAYRLAMSDRAALDSVLKCANMFMERALGRPKEHIEVKVSSDAEAMAAVRELMEAGVMTAEGRWRSLRRSGLSCQLLMLKQISFQMRVYYD